MTPQVKLKIYKMTTIVQKLKPDIMAKPVIDTRGRYEQMAVWKVYFSH